MANEKVEILIVEKNPSDILAAKLLLPEHNLTIKSNLKDAEQAIIEGYVCERVNNFYDALLSDLYFEDKSSYKMPKILETAFEKNIPHVGGIATKQKYNTPSLFEGQGLVDIKIGSEMIALAYKGGFPNVYLLENKIVDKPEGAILVKNWKGALDALLS